MKRARVGLLLYDALLLAILFGMGVLSGQFPKNLGVLAILLPVLIYFSGKLINLFVRLDRRRLPHVMLLSRVLYMYSAVITLLLFIASLTLIRSLPELFFSLVFLPLPGYFFLNAYVGYRRWKRALRRIVVPAIKTTEKKTAGIKKTEIGKPQAASAQDLPQVQTDMAEVIEVAESAPEETTPLTDVTDVKRRQFLKLLGGGSLGMIVMLFLSPQKASAAFFGSVPGPGTVALKDTTGAQIDPKEKTPTDGYTISQVDDIGPTNYYGFVNKAGAWYISKEGNDGSYRYVKGASGFSTNWTNRASLSYDYFDNVF